MSRITHSLFTRVAPVAAGFALMAGLAASASNQRFYHDDPIERITDSQDASKVEARDIDLTYDTLENSFSWPGDRTPDVRAQNLNTADEVPDSTWFTNRVGTRAMTVDELFVDTDETGGGKATLHIDAPDRVPFIPTHFVDHTVGVDIADIARGDEPLAIDLGALFRLVVIGEVRIGCEARKDLEDSALFAEEMARQLEARWSSPLYRRATARLFAPTRSGRQ